MAIAGPGACGLCEGGKASRGLVIPVRLNRKPFRIRELSVRVGIVLRSEYKHIPEGDARGTSG